MAPTHWEEDAQVICAIVTTLRNPMTPAALLTPKMLATAQEAIDALVLLHALYQCKAMQAQRVQ